MSDGDYNPFDSIYVRSEETKKRHENERRQEKKERTLVTVDKGDHLIEYRWYVPPSIWVRRFPIPQLEIEKVFESDDGYGYEKVF